MTVVCIRRTRAPRVLLLGALTLVLAACHTSVPPPGGTAVISMGDLSGDFSSYIITLNSITLTSTTGGLATPLVTPQIVDFVQLTDRGELVEAPAVPAATYTSATIALDFSAIQILLNYNGVPTPAAAVDVTGALLSTVSVPVNFDPANPLVITTGQSAYLRIDVDLAVSNSVNFSTSPPTVTVQPFVVVTPAPIDSTPMRARGILVTASQGAMPGQFIMNLRPFVDLYSALGSVFVQTNAQTYFNIEGITFTGSAGLAALAQQPLNTVIAAVGTLSSLSGVTPTFNATEVYAGSSIYSPLYDFVTGTVSARSGNTLTISGTSYVTALGAEEFFQNSTVTLGSGTYVTADGVPTANLSTQSISIGQVITTSGVSSPTAAGGLSLDASSNQVRLAPTPLWGTLNASPPATPGSASLDVVTLGNYAPVGLNFAGTGLTPAQDANPMLYAVNTGSTDLSTEPPQTLVQMYGLVSPFGSAPPDFNLNSVVFGAQTEQQLVVEWTNGGSAAPFSSISASGLVVNLSDPNLGSVHYIRTGPTTLDLTSPSIPSSPLITTTGANPSSITLAVGAINLSTGISVFNSYPPFETALNNTLNGNNPVFRLVARGQYVAASNTFVASRIDVAIQEQ